MEPVRSAGRWSIAATLAASLGTFLHFQILITIVPLAAERSMGNLGAGLATAALMIPTVAAQLVAPRITARFGFVRPLAASLFVLGAPSLLYAFPTSFTGMMAITAVRGLAFGLITVIVTALIVIAVPAEKRGRSFGLYGLLSGLAAVVGSPVALYMAGFHGTAPVYLLATVLPLLAIPAAWWLIVDPTGADLPNAGFRPLARIARAKWPALAFLAATFGYGAVVSYVPLAAGANAAAVMLAFGIAFASWRWISGHIADSLVGAKWLLTAALVASAAGLLLVAAAGDESRPALMIVALLLFGAGLGTSMTASYLALVAALEGAGVILASTLWNVAYDLGLGAAGVVLGFATARFGLQPAFLISAALIAAAALPPLMGLLPRGGRAVNSS